MHWVYHLKREWGPFVRWQRNGQDISYEANHVQQRRVICERIFAFYLQSKVALKTRDSSKWKEIAWLAGGTTYLVNCWLPATAACPAHSFLKPHLSFSHSPAGCCEVWRAKSACRHTVTSQECLRSVKFKSGHILHTEDNWVPSASFSNEPQTVFTAFSREHKATR